MPKKVITDGTNGDDVIEGGNYQDIVDGLGGDDIISGGNQHDILAGGSGNDKVNGNNGKDSVDGGGGDDIVAGNNGKDKVYGGPGRDKVSGGNGKDELSGGPALPDDEDDFAGPNEISGGNGKDRIISSYGFCIGDDDDDGDVDSDSGDLAADFAVDDSGTGHTCSIDDPIDDTMTGGRAPDTFVFNLNHGRDVITDFWKDKIELIELGLANGFDDLTITNNESGDAVIDTGQGTITLLGVAAEDVGADAFIF